VSPDFGGDFTPNAAPDTATPVQDSAPPDSKRANKVSTDFEPSRSATASACEPYGEFVELSLSKGRNAKAARISPVSWFLARHVRDGRPKLNFDEWSAAAATDQLEEIYDSIAKKKMPLASYLLMHPEARLSQADREAVLAWADGKL
jgi:hypothetical protein